MGLVMKHLGRALLLMVAVPMLLLVASCGQTVYASFTEPDSLTTGLVFKWANNGDRLYSEKFENCYYFILVNGSGRLAMTHRGDCTNPLHRYSRPPVAIQDTTSKKSEWGW